MLGFSSIAETSIAELPGAFVPVSGQSATSALGSLSSVIGTANVTLTGISATLSLADVLIWGKVVPGVTTTYANVSTSNSPTWTTVTTGASQTWTEEKR